MLLYHTLTTPCHHIYQLLSSNEEQYYLLCPWFDFSNVICGIKVLLPERTDVPSLETIPKYQLHKIYASVFYKNCM